MWNKWKTSLRYNRIGSSISFKNCLCRDHIWTARESVTPDDAAIDGLIYVRCEIHPVWSRRSDPSWLVGQRLITPLLREPLTKCWGRRKLYTDHTKVSANAGRGGALTHPLRDSHADAWLRCGTSHLFPPFTISLFPFLSLARWLCRVCSLSLPVALISLRDVREE